MPKILVLLASHNGARWIREQINSILCQTDVSLHLVIRDDASTDNTHTELNALQLDPTRVTVLATHHPSGSAARNFFQLICENQAETFDFVAFSDQDDVWLPDKLSRACSLMRRNGGDAYSSATTAFWEINGARREIKLSPAQSQSDFLFEGAGQGCTFVLTASTYQRIKKFFEENLQLLNEVHFHDWAIYAISRSWGLNWILDPRPSLLYRQHESNDIGARQSIHGILRRLHLIRSGWYKKQLKEISKIICAAAPENSVAKNWNQALNAQPGIPRTYFITRCIIRGPRRNLLNNVVLLGATLAGWI